MTPDTPSPADAKGGDQRWLVEAYFRMKAAIDFAGNWNNDFDEVCADGGVTVAMAFRQQCNSLSKWLDAEAGRRVGLSSPPNGGAPSRPLAPVSEGTPTDPLLLARLDDRAEMFDAPHNPELMAEAAAAIRRLEEEVEKLRFDLKATNELWDMQIKCSAANHGRATRAEARASSLEEALRPFAAMADALNDWQGADTEAVFTRLAGSTRKRSGIIERHYARLTAEDFRRARQALSMDAA